MIKNTNIEKGFSKEELASIQFEVVEPCEDYEYPQGKPIMSVEVDLPDCYSIAVFNPAFQQSSH